MPRPPYTHKGVTIIVRPSECTKYDCFKTPVYKNFVKESIYNPTRYNTNTGYQYILKDNYSVMSGPFSPTYLRHFSTEIPKWNTKREDEFEILDWVQKTKINKNKKPNGSIKDNDDMLNLIWKQLVNDMKEQSSVNPLKKKKNLLINAKISIFCKYFHVLSVANLPTLNDSITMSGTPSKNENNSLLYSSKEVLSHSLALWRWYHFSPTINFVLTNKIDVMNFLPCVLLKKDALVIYKAPEKQLSLFVKYYHDWKTPDFTEYRKKQVECPEVLSNQSVIARKLPTYTCYTLFGLAWAYGIKGHATHYVMTMAASAEVLALAKIEINLSEITEGRSITFKWRGKPLFIRHRTPAQIETERNVDISLLRDPEKDEDRVKDPKWLVVLGVCTHLGCVPIADAGDYPGGYYCPCHGSHFDGSGRTRKGPAPTNLEVPYYVFDGDIIIVG